MPVENHYSSGTEEYTHALGLDVETHSIIVGLVAARLVDRMTEFLKSTVFLPGSELLAAAHDVGKLNPHFQEKLRRTLTDYIPNSFLGLETANPELEKRTGWHAGVSQVTLKDEASYIGIVVGNHHGYSPNIGHLQPNDDVLGGELWQILRLSLIDKLKNYFQVDWPKLDSAIQVSAVAGLVTVSDWIGSGIFFESKVEIPLNLIPPLIERAIDNAGFIPPKIKPNLAFEEIFPFSPRPIQTALYERVTSPGVYVLEAPMGVGKTEAALYAAYLMLVRGEAHGIYFALPTQLTSQKLHQRMQAFLDQILELGDKHKSLLLHSNAWLYETDLGVEGRPGYSWFDGRKRAILAPFAVGTIDQALMAVMNVKHSFVRTFGLAGKVVILDEVHSYDAYTGSIMDYLIQNLNALGCTIILLSATLTNKRKLSLLPVSSTQNYENLPNHYPLITLTNPSNTLVFSEIIDLPDNCVNLEITDNIKVTIEHVREAAFNGQLVLWIENTVGEAQSAFKAFAAWGHEVGIEVGLLHSRFPPIVRNEIEDYWVSLYGKGGAKQRKKSGKILIGTQVLEQSLDIDADLLISRIAPIDMLLQRIGRLWRHKEIDNFRPNLATRKAIILSPPLSVALSEPVYAFGATSAIYASYVLARTCEVISARTCINIPSEMRELIESTYSDRNESGSMAFAKHTLFQEREKLRTRANHSLSNIGMNEPEAVVTRFSEIPSRDVLLLRQYSRDKVVLIDGKTITLPKNKPLELSIRKRIAQLLTERLISVPNYIAPEFVSRGELAWLSPYLFISDKDEERLRVAVLAPDGTIMGLFNRVASEKYNLNYSTQYGYAAVKKEEK